MKFREPAKQGKILLLQKSKNNNSHFGEVRGKYLNNPRPKANHFMDAI
jgi:hypothetical protein